MALAPCLLSAGVFFIVKGLTDDTRARQIAVFREFLRRPSSGLPPLPSRFHGRPPNQLRASWTPGFAAARAFNFNLDILEVPLTADVLADKTDVDDEAPLSAFGVNGTSINEVEDAQRSVLYRAVVPGKIFWAGTEGNNEKLDVGAGTLEVWLPDSQLLLRHKFEPVRWRPAALAKDSNWIGVARLCYALSEDVEKAHVDGATAGDCEYQQRSPVYGSLGVDGGSLSGGVEVVLRSATDAYVRASEITRGCSNCQGRPYGPGGVIGAKLWACGHTAAAWTSVTWQLNSRHCFGPPARHTQANGLALLGLGVAALAVFVVLHARALVDVMPPGRPVPEGIVLTPRKLQAFGTRLARVSGAIFLFALVTYSGLPGVLRRSAQPGGSLSRSLAFVCWVSWMVAGLLPVGALAFVTITSKAPSQIWAKLKALGAHYLQT